MRTLACLLTLGSVFPWEAEGRFPQRIPLLAPADNFKQIFAFNKKIAKEKVKATILIKN
jgi:hypothetical protein